MAETKRTKADLLTRLADNTTGDISPEDVRDIVESYDLGRGAYYWSAFATTTFTLQGTQGPGGTNYVKLGGTTTARTLRHFTHASPNRLTYTGTPTIRFNLWAALSYSMDVAGSTQGLQIHKNGVAEVSSYQESYVPTTLTQNVVVLLDGTLATSDYLEVWGNCQTAAGRIYTPRGGFVIVQEEPLG